MTTIIAQFHLETRMVELRTQPEQVRAEFPTPPQRLTESLTFGFWIGFNICRRAKTALALFLALVVSAAASDEGAAQESALFGPTPPSGAAGKQPQRPRPKAPISENDALSGLSPEMKECLERMDHAERLNERVVTLWRAGKFKEALPLAEEVLRIRQDVLGRHHVATAETLFILAAQYEALGRYAQAEPLYLQACDIQKKVLGEEHPSYAVTLNNLAGVYASLDRHAEAERLYLQAREILKKTPREERNYATTLANLAELYASMRQYSKAEPLYLQARDIRKQVLGEEHPDYATTLVSFPQTCAWQKNRRGGGASDR